MAIKNFLNELRQRYWADLHGFRYVQQGMSILFLVLLVVFWCAWVVREYRVSRTTVLETGFVEIKEAAQRISFELDTIARKMEKNRGGGFPLDKEHELFYTDNFDSATMAAFEYTCVDRNSLQPLEIFGLLELPGSSQGVLIYPVGEQGDLMLVRTFGKTSCGAKLRRSYFFQYVNRAFNVNRIAVAVLLMQKPAQILDLPDESEIDGWYTKYLAASDTSLWSPEDTTYLVKNGVMQRQSFFAFYGEGDLFTYPEALGTAHIPYSNLVYGYRWMAKVDIVRTAVAFAPSLLIVPLLWFILFFYIRFESARLYLPLKKLSNWMKDMQTGGKAEEQQVPMTGMPVWDGLLRHLNGLIRGHSHLLELKEAATATMHSEMQLSHQLALSIGKGAAADGTAGLVNVLPAFSPATSNTYIKVNENCIHSESKRSILYHYRNPHDEIILFLGMAPSYTMEYLAGVIGGMYASLTLPELRKAMDAALAALQVEQPAGDFGGFGVIILDKSGNRLFHCGDFKWNVDIDRRKGLAVLKIDRLSNRARDWIVHFGSVLFDFNSDKLEVATVTLDKSEAAPTLLPGEIRR